MEKKILSIPNISCGHCASAIENELRDLTGVLSAKGDVVSKTVTVEWEKPASLARILETLKEINYPAAE